MSKFTYTIFRPSDAHTTGEIEWPDEPGYKAIAAFVDPIIGGHLEHVTVLHKGARADMFVEEFGAVNGMPVNVAATEIYWAASKARGEHPERDGAPKIHGIAVLFDERVWL